MIKINKAVVLFGMLLLAAFASAAQEAENIQAETQPGMGMPNLNARRLNTFFKGGFYGNPYGYYGYPYGFYNPYFGYNYGRFGSFFG